ncbi:OmpA family protein [Treponema sp. OMZ 840]|uniref:OmpA family protein n=1 Tax=Treponema sp. OMZ 840 TaxID=244313 RepID=UPI003D8B803D
MHKRVKYVILPILSLIFLSFTVPCRAENFIFKYKTGNSYRILSTVNEEVFINGKKSFNSIIVNRISVKEKKVHGDGSADIEARFMTSENASREGETPHFVWGEEYESFFTRSKLGHYTIGEEAFMPVVRNVPVFTGKDMRVGDTWTASGEEAHDLRINFGLQKPFKVPFTASYTYKGTEHADGKKLHVISVKYNLFFESPVPAGNTKNLPLTTMGYSDQTLYWDNERGFLDHYHERFRIIIETTAGTKLEFRGNAQAAVSELENLKESNVLERVQNQIREMGIENTTASADEKGITISLENIQFEAESAVLTESELLKLRKIGEILKDFPDYDLLISGHTALAGTQAGRLRLSEERAWAVADYLAELGVKNHERLFTKGFGAQIPIAPNTTEEGKARNRRVEITILDK